MILTTQNLDEFIHRSNCRNPWYMSWVSTLPYWRTPNKIYVSYTGRRVI